MLKKVMVSFSALFLFLGIFIYYFTFGKPLMFLDTMHWAFSPRHKEILSLDMVKWMKIDNVQKLNIMKTGMGPYPHKEGYLFVTRGQSNIYGGYASGNTPPPPEKRYGVRYTLVIKGDSIRSWGEKDSTDIEKLNDIGHVHELGRTGSGMLYASYIKLGQFITLIRG